MTVAEISQGITDLDPKWFEHARTHLDNLTKPLGSLGRLEEIAARMIAIREGKFSRPLNKAVFVFAADHGITAEGVSAYPKEVTNQMVMNFLSNGAAINVLAKLHDADLVVVDVGVDADFGGVPGMLHSKVRAGTRNMLHGPAMTEDDLAREPCASDWVWRDAAGVLCWSDGHGRGLRDAAGSVFCDQQSGEHCGGNAGGGSSDHQLVGIPSRCADHDAACALGRRADLA